MSATAAAAARTFLRSPATQGMAARLPSSLPKARAAPKSTFAPFPTSKQTPTISLRISRSPVELSFCVETMLPYHTATASALLRSKLSTSCCGYYWSLKDSKDDV